MQKNRFIQLFILLLLSFITPVFSFTQSNFTLSGTVQDKETGTTLPNVKLQITPSKTIEITDSSGYFFFSLIPGSYHLDIKCLGYKPISKTISISENKNLEIEFIDNQNSVIAVKGSVPGKNGSDLIVKLSNY